MPAYWITFRIHKNVTYEKRYDGLIEAIRLSTDTDWWFETTSFYLIKSKLNIDGLSSAIKNAIDESVDLVVIGMPDFKTARYIGNLQDHDISKLLPFIKKA